MAKKSLILYASMSGNTEKVALRFKEVFERKGWECDLLKVTSKIDIYNSPFDCSQYDFICAGSFVHKSLPSERLVDMMRWNPNNVHYSPNGEAIRKAEPSEEELEDRLRGGDLKPPEGFSGGPLPQEPPILIFGPQDKKGIVFVTYAGEHQGPKEALPSLALLQSELEHLRYQCIGTFACPGRFGKVRGWFQDLPERPNEKDLMRAELFMEEKLERL